MLKRPEAEAEKLIRMGILPIQSYHILSLSQVLQTAQVKAIIGHNLHMRVHRDSLHDIEWLSSEQLSEPLSGGIALMVVCQEYHHNPRPDQTMENVEVISV